MKIDSCDIKLLSSRMKLFGGKKHKLVILSQHLLSS